MYFFETLSANNMELRSIKKEIFISQKDHLASQKGL